MMDAWAGADIEDPAQNEWVEERARELFVDLVDDAAVVWTGSALELDAANDSHPDVRAAIVTAMNVGRTDVNMGAGGQWTIVAA